LHANGRDMDGGHARALPVRRERRKTITEIFSQS
jgi:hypothetical protein